MRGVNLFKNMASSLVAEVDCVVLRVICEPTYLLHALSWQN